MIFGEEEIEETSHLGYANPALEIYSNLVVNGGSITFNYDAGSTNATSLGAVPSSPNSSNIVLNGGTQHAGHSTTIGATRGIYVGSGGGTIADVTSSGTVTIASPISGPVTINSGAKLAPGPTASSVGTLTISNNLTFAGNVAIAINKSLSPSNSAVVVTGILANSGSGTLSVTNLGTALAVGDKFQIFNGPLTGNAMAVSGGGVTWNNNLAVDGSISVATVPSGHRQFFIQRRQPGPDRNQWLSVGWSQRAYLHQRGRSADELDDLHHRVL